MALHFNKLGYRTLFSSTKISKFNPEGIGWRKSLKKSGKSLLCAINGASLLSIPAMQRACFYNRSSARRHGIISHTTLDLLMEVAHGFEWKLISVCCGADGIRMYRHLEYQ